MAATGTGNYKKAYPMVRVIAGGVFPFTASAMVRDKSDIKQISDLKGKRVAWDYGGHAISQTFLNAVLETGGIKPGDVQQVRVSNVNDGIRAVPEGKVDASWASLGTGTNEEANAMEPVRMLNIPNTDASNKILGRYGGSVVKATPSAGVRGDTYVLGYALHIVGFEQAQRSRGYGAHAKLGGIIWPSCRRSIHCSSNGPRRTRRSPISRFPTTPAR